MCTIRSKRSCRVAPSASAGRSSNSDPTGSSGTWQDVAVTAWGVAFAAALG